MRQSFLFEAEPGEQLVPLPEFKSRYRIVTLFGRLINNTGGVCVPQLEVFDGTMNLVGVYPCLVELPDSVNAVNITWSPGVIPTSTLLGTGAFVITAINDDLWIELGWTVRLNGNPSIDAPQFWESCNLVFSANTKELVGRGFNPSPSRGSSSSELGDPLDAVAGA